MKNIIRSILLISFGAILYNCKSKGVITERITSDTTIIREIPKIVQVPGDTIYSNPINIDSIITMIQSGIPTNVIEKYTIQEDPETKNRVGILIDELGNLTALCEIQDQEIEYLQKEIERYKSEMITITKPPTFLERIKGAWDLLVVTLFLVLVFMVLLKKI